MADTILVVDDDLMMREMLNILLTDQLGYKVVSVGDGRQAIERIRSADAETYGAVLLDIAMPEMDGFETLRSIRNFQPNLPVLMLTGNSNIESSVRAIKEGANDFIAKPVDPAHLEVALKNALRLSAMSKELTRVKRDLEGALAFTDLIGHDSGLVKAVSYGRKAALSDIPVLIMGDTGVGKELFARAIHGESKRMGAPFIAINCGAIPPNLVESTLFGHEKGSFTGATSRSMGKFREAEGGTIFLDEIGELPMDAQVKILRVLQQREVEPVGAGKPVKVDVRVISATNRDLKADVKSGRFREDLYFRLNVFPIRVPSLSERGDDVVKLAQYFIQRDSASDMIPLKTLSEDAQKYLLQYPWPGNVRELENLIRRAMVLGEGNVIHQKQLMEFHDSPDISASSPSFHGGSAISLERRDGSLKTMEEIENEVMQAALERYDHNITQASESLGIAKSTFYRKIKHIK